MTFTSQTEATSPVEHRTAKAAALRADAIDGWVDGPVDVKITFTDGGLSSMNSTKVWNRGKLRECLGAWAPGSLLPEDWTDE